MNSTLTIEIRSGNSGRPAGQYTPHFDFNPDSLTGNLYTCEIWVKTGSGVPQVGGQALSAATMAIDGWVLYRGNFEVDANQDIIIVLPSGHYDDFRIYPSAANVKTYVYHPWKAYLMAVLDENNFATYYEYNHKNQLVRLKKETEKGILTLTENIKNVSIK